VCGATPAVAVPAALTHALAARMKAACGIAALLLVSGCGTFLHAPATAVPAVARFAVFETQFTSATRYDNPDTDVTVTVSFVAPSGRALLAHAFPDGDGLWRVRFAPDEIGAWTYSVSASDASNRGFSEASGNFKVTRATSAGFIRPDARSPYWFSFSDGSAYFGIGDTAYGLSNAVSDTQLEQYLDLRKKQGFNFVRLFAAGAPHGGHPSLAVQESWAWGGTPSAPDYDRINPLYFHRLERLLRELATRDMHAEIELFNYYSAPFDDPQLWTPAREAVWLRTVVSRLAAYRSVFLWTLANEYELHPDGKYRYDGATDDDWVRRVATQVHAFDPHQHPTTVHSFSFDARGGLGGRFGSGPELDVLSQQIWGEATWNGNYLDGQAAGIERSIWADRSFGKPVINTENGYEWLAGYHDFDQQTVGTDKARRAAWRTFVSGGAAYAAGFAGTWPGSDAYTWKGVGPLHFRLEDMGLGAQIGHLRDFIARIDLLKMSPAQQLVNEPNLCLANSGETYVVYAPQGGPVELDLSSTHETFVPTWFDPRTGELHRRTPLKGGSRTTLKSPDAQDWVLMVREVRNPNQRSVISPP
jgi:Protein of unknown function (DUF4038)/Domain of unknown function (DUF5060)/Putative collagen-binding domain of a collagenase